MSVEGNMDTDMASALKTMEIGDFARDAIQHHPEETARLDKVVYATPTEAASSADEATRTAGDAKDISAATLPTSSYMRLWIRDIPFSGAENCGNALLYLHFPEPGARTDPSTQASHACVTAANAEDSDAGDISEKLPALAAYLHSCCPGRPIPLYQEVVHDLSEAGVESAVDQEGSSVGQATEICEEDDARVEYRKVEPVAGTSPDE